MLNDYGLQYNEWKSLFTIGKLEAIMHNYLILLNLYDKLNVLLLYSFYLSSNWNAVDYIIILLLHK